MTDSAYTSLHWRFTAFMSIPCTICDLFLFHYHLQSKHNWQAVAFSF